MVKNAIETNRKKAPRHSLFSDRLWLMLSAMKDPIFYLGFGTLFAHELDSMLNHEWRVMPIVGALSDETGSMVFVLAHIPIVALLVALVSSENPRTRRLTRVGVGIFLALHGVLHILFGSHPDYEFSSVLSHTFIFGGAILGLLYVALEWIGRRGYGAQ